MSTPTEHARMRARAERLEMALREIVLIDNKRVSDGLISRIAREALTGTLRRD